MCEAEANVRVEGDFRCLTKNQAPHSEAFLVCLHGPCMRAGPGAEFGDDVSESVCRLS